MRLDSSGTSMMSTSGWARPSHRRPCPWQANSTRQSYFDDGRSFPRAEAGASGVPPCSGRCALHVPNPLSLGRPTSRPVRPMRTRLGRERPAFHRRAGRRQPSLSPCAWSAFSGCVHATRPDPPPFAAPSAAAVRRSPDVLPCVLLG